MGKEAQLNSCHTIYSPPEKDVQWSDEGINSSFKFIQKLWVLNQRILEEIKADHPETNENELKKKTTRFINDVQNNIENFSYNKIIANCHEIYSALNKIINNKIDKKSWIENYKNILVAMNPVIPHFSSECLETLEIKNIENNVYWPKISKNVLVEDDVNFVIQINGKTREVLKIKKGINEKDLLIFIKKNEKINNYIKEKTIGKTIFIKDKLINIIIPN